MVCNRRTRLFSNEGNCRILARVFEEIREKHPFKLCSYVFMPDHVHMIVNPLRPELSTILNKIKGKSARLILDRLMKNGSERMLERLYLNVANRNYAVWQTRSAVIDIVSSEFMIQKTGYIHDNPVRAGLCKHPKDWKWSSYRALHPANRGLVPLRVDRPMDWKPDEIMSARPDWQFPNA